MTYYGRRVMKIGLLNHVDSSNAHRSDYIEFSYPFHQSIELIEGVS